MDPSHWLGWLRAIVLPLSAQNSICGSALPRPISDSAWKVNPVPKIASRHKASSLTHPRVQAEPIIRSSVQAPSAWMKKWGSGLAHSCGLILGRAFDMCVTA